MSRRAIMVVGAGCLLLLLSFGIRSSFGLFQQPLVAAQGWGREVFALAIALQNLLWGATQPFAGALCDRYGGRLVAFGGAILYILGCWLMAVTSDPLLFSFGSGLLIGAGMSGVGFAVVLAEIGRVVPPERRGMALGFGTAAGSFGQFAVVPLGQAMLVSLGWSGALIALTFVALLLIPLAFCLSGSGTRHDGPAQSLGEAVREAAAHRGYWLLTIGYFVCGFHVAFIGTHLPAYLVDNGIEARWGAWALSMVGLFNILGSFVFGVLGDRRRKKYLLAGIYLSRSAVLLLFLVMPLSPLSVMLFASAMGVLWLSTVPLTTGLVGQIFGVRYLAMLGGVVFFSHQIGSFVGVYAGGKLFDLTGSYDAIWWASVALGLLAALLHWPIDDRSVVRAPAATPA
ncbi:MAG: MFS transporter [Alphaproteobacteria bacterium]|nr:MFS transporter [Alphaproteobacteria bacterium]